MRKAQRREKPVARNEPAVPRIEKPAEPLIEIDTQGPSPEDEFRVPILEVLVHLGGSGRASYVVERVGERMSHKLTTADRGRIETGSIRWEKTVHFAKFRMVKDGFLEPPASGYGVWKLTAAGWKVWQNVLDFRNRQE